MRMLLVSICLATLVGAACAAEPASSAAGSTTVRLIVMDPLAKELSCPCVQGYAQRDYLQLARYLEKQLGAPVAVSFSESLVKALKNDTDGQVDIVIGKRSVVEYDAERAGVERPLLGRLAISDAKWRDMISGLRDVAALVGARAGSEILVAGRKAPYGHELWLPLMSFFVKE